MTLCVTFLELRRFKEWQQRMKSEEESAHSSKNLLGNASDKVDFIDFFFSKMGNGRGDREKYCIAIWFLLDPPG